MPAQALERFGPAVNFLFESCRRRKLHFPRGIAHFQYLQQTLPRELVAIHCNQLQEEPRGLSRQRTRAP